MKLSLPCSQFGEESIQCFTIKVILAENFLWMLLSSWESSHQQKLVCWVLIMNAYWILLNAFLSSIDMIIWFFFCNLLLYINIYIYSWFLNNEPGLHTWNKSHLVVVYNFIFQEGGDMCIPMADSCWSCTEATQYCKAIILQLKIN